MAWLLEGAAAFCLVYYGIIVFYSGITTSFSLCWPVFAVILLFLAGAVHYYRRFKESVPLWLTVSVITAFGAFFAVFVLIELLIGLGALTSTKQAVDYMVVLGAKVDEGKISHSLEQRLNKTIEYAEDHPNTVIVLSGGHGQDAGISEAEVMYDYLVFNGIPKERLLLETKSRNTKENVLFSMDVIEEQEWSRDSILKTEFKTYHGRQDGDRIKIAILTSNFHVFRAKEIAKKQGMDNVYGIAASSDPVVFLHFWVRECFAVLKDKFMGNM